MSHAYVVHFFSMKFTKLHLISSPDWFSGLYNLSMWKTNSNGENVWYQKVKVHVYAWDAGTEDGNSYSLSNRATNPKKPMFPFEPSGNSVFVSKDSNGGPQVLPVGMLSFDLRGQNQECASLSMASSLASPSTSTSQMLADTMEVFRVRVRRKNGAKRLRMVNCMKWVATRPKNRCNKVIRRMNGRKTKTRVRDLCPITCMSK